MTDRVPDWVYMDVPPGYDELDEELERRIPVTAWLIAAWLVAAVIVVAVIRWLRP